MNKIPQIILKAYLRRWPLHLRKSQFNLLTQYSWLKTPLKDIRNEFFPKENVIAEPEILASEEDSLEAPLTIQVLRDRLHGDSVSGMQGSYRLEDGVLARQGRGYLLAGLDEISKQSVVIKYYRLPSAYMSPAELSVGQQQFCHIERLSHPDNQLREDLRVTWPIDAIADFHQNDCYFLVMDSQSHGPTLTQWLAQQQTPLSSAKARQVIGQLLQSLMHLHHQPIRLASERLQVGLTHGNLNTESVLCVERAGEDFFYLSDFAIWENLFHATNQTYPSVDLNGEATAAAIQDLVDLGVLGLSLLEWQGAGTNLLESQEKNFNADKFLRTFLQQLKNEQFQNSELAWQAWLRLPSLAAPEAATLSYATKSAKGSGKSGWWRLVAGGSLLALLTMAGGWWFLLRSPSSQPAALPCCINTVGGVPEGSFRHSTVKNGGWQRVLNRQHLLRQDVSLQRILEDAHSSFNIGLAEPILTDTIQGSIDKVSSGEAAFAIVPLVNEIELPPNLGYKTIAYDGLAVFVPYSYNAREGSIPSRQGGKIAVQDIRKIYSTNNPENLDISRRYITTDKEAVQVLEQEVLLGPLALGTQVNTPEMLRNMLKEFEEFSADKQDFPIGIASLSDVMKQCSIYPLAVASPGKEAVQPLTMEDGTPISPETNLCDNKNLYQPNVDIFKRDEYPLAYPIVVVFPQDNRELSAGQRFADLMRTTQVQQLFLEVGLVPIVDSFELARGDVLELGENSNPEQHSNSTQEDSQDDDNGRKVRLAAPRVKVPEIPILSNDNLLSPKAPVPSPTAVETVSESLFPEVLSGDNMEDDT